MCVPSQELRGWARQEEDVSATREPEVGSGQKAVVRHTTTGVCVPICCDEKARGRGEPRPVARFAMSWRE